MKRTAAVVGIVACGLAAAPAAGATFEQERIQWTYGQWRTGLRHEDGTQACRHLTLHFRLELIRAFADKVGVAGLGCRTLIDIYGRELWNSGMRDRSQRLTRITVTGSRARARSNTAATICFRKIDGRWLMNESRPGSIRCP